MTCILEEKVTELDLTAHEIMDRFAEPFARALAVFVRESSRRDVLGDADRGDSPPDLSKKEGESLDEFLARRLARAIREHDALEKNGTLCSVEVNEESISQAVATRLRWVIKDRGLSQRELAKKIGVTPAALSRVLKNPDSSKVTTLRKISQALDVDLGRIL